MLRKLWEAASARPMRALLSDIKRHMAFRWKATLAWLSQSVVRTKGLLSPKSDRSMARRQIGLSSRNELTL